MKYILLTPNLVVHDVQAALHFYQSVLGFEAGMTVPDAPPYVFGSVTNGGGVEIFFNDQKAVAEALIQNPGVPEPWSELRVSS